MIYICVLVFVFTDNIFKKRAKLMKELGTDFYFFHVGLFRLFL